MAKNKKEPTRKDERTAAEYYKLNTKAIDDLVTADESNSPAVDQKELRKYRSTMGKKKMAPWLKVTLLKTWFAGMVCFYFMWGLGIYLQYMLDQIVVTGVALGLVWDLLLNNLLHFMESTPGENDRWMMFPQKGFISLPLNLLYALVLIFLVYNTYGTLDAVLRTVMGRADETVMGVEPILFGLLVMGWDTLLVKMKAMLKKIVSDAKNQVRSGK